VERRDTPHTARTLPCLVTGEQDVLAASGWPGLELPLEERESLAAGLRQIDFFDGEIAAVERLIARQALSWPEIRRLMTVPAST
jgi:hypothetical protein